MKKIVVIAALSLLLAGCSGASEKTDDAKPKKVATAVASQDEPTEVVEDQPDPVILDEVDCGGEYYSSVEEAWEGHYDMCDATVTGTEMSDTETKALAVAYGDEGDLDSLGTLYGLCAQSGADSWSYLQTAGSKEQVAEVRGMLLLCPAHPQENKLRKLVGGAEELNKLEDEGRVFGAGLYRVGKDIKPGTYYTTDVENCYWERTDANGETIDNNFITAAKRVQVTIGSGDYSFNSDSCGQWQPVGT